MALPAPMASAVLPLPTRNKPLLHLHHHRRHLHATVTCGPRDNRGPLVRGRTLSTEAILAVQALKRAGGDDARVDRVISGSMVRLIKADLLAALKELQRQDQWRLALKVFVAVRREYWDKVDYGLYADMVAALSRNGMYAEIDTLVRDLLEESKHEGMKDDDLRGLAKLLKALIGAKRGEAVKAIYGAMKNGGCVGDEYLFKLLSKGLRRLGDGDTADEVERDHAIWFDHGGRRESLSI